MCWLSGLPISVGYHTLKRIKELLNINEGLSVLEYNSPKIKTDRNCFQSLAIFKHIYLCYSFSYNVHFCHIYCSKYVNEVYDRFRMKIVFLSIGLLYILAVS